MQILLKQLLLALGIVEMAEAADGTQAFFVMNTFEPDITPVD